MFLLLKPIELLNFLTLSTNSRKITIIFTPGRGPDARLERSGRALGARRGRNGPKRWNKKHAKVKKLTAREKRGKDPKRGVGGWRVGEVAAGFAAIAGVTALGRAKRPGPQLRARQPVQVPGRAGSWCVSPIAFEWKTTSLARMARAEFAPAAPPARAQRAPVALQARPRPAPRCENKCNPM